MDNGPEFTGRVLDQRAFQRGVKLHFIDLGEPVQNAFVESFNGKSREECLSASWFESLRCRSGPDVVGEATLRPIPVPAPTPFSASDPSSPNALAAPSC